ncbi:unnamed protein product, partial [Didymodactylos carnosus]
MNHGCYPFAINQLFNQEANQQSDNRNLKTLKLNLIRSSLNDGGSKSTFNISAFIYSRNEMHHDPDYIYLNRFLVDFIRFVTLPIHLIENERFLCYKSSRSTEYIKGHSTFFIDVTTFFGLCRVQVGVLSRNTTNNISINVADLDPISIVLRCYHELVLGTNSGEQYNDSPLSQCFSVFFDAFKLVKQDDYDRILARYFAEIYGRNYFSNVKKYFANLHLAKSESEAYEYFKKELNTLKNVFQDREHGSHETRETAEYLYKALYNATSIYRYENNNSHFIINNIQLVPLFLEFNKLRQRLRELHKSYGIDSIQQTLKSVLALYFFIKIKLNRLVVVFKDNSVRNRLLYWSAPWILGGGPRNLAPDIKEFGIIIDGNGILIKEVPKT